MPASVSPTTAPTTRANTEPKPAQLLVSRSEEGPRPVALMLKAEEEEEEGPARREEAGDSMSCASLASRRERGASEMGMMPVRQSVNGCVCGWMEG